VAFRLPLPFGKGGTVLIMRKLIVLVALAVCAYPASARAQTQVGGFGGNGLSGPPSTILNTVLGIINSNRRMVGVGGGVQFGHKEVAVDVGYRYKEISTGNTAASFLNLNKPYNLNQVRLGIGVRF